MQSSRVFDSELTENAYACSPNAIPLLSDREHPHVRETALTLAGRSDHSNDYLARLLGRAYYCGERPRHVCFTVATWCRTGITTFSRNKSDLKIPPPVLTGDTIACRPVSRWEARSPRCILSHSEPIQPEARTQVIRARSALLFEPASARVFGHHSPICHQYFQTTLDTRLHWWSNNQICILAEWFRWPATPHDHKQGFLGPINQVSGHLLQLR